MDFRYGKVLHAAMVQRTDALSAGPARYLLLHMHGFRIVRLGPGNVRGAKEADNRAVKSCGKMPGPTVGGNREATPPHQGLGQAEREFFIGKPVHGLPRGAAGDRSRQLAFTWPTQD